MGVALGSCWSLVVGFGLLVWGPGGGRPSHPSSRSWVTSWNTVLVPASLGREVAHLHQLWPPAAFIIVVVILEELETAVDHCRIHECSIGGSCYFEQEGERICLVVVQFRVRNEGLEDVITNHILFYIPKIGTVGDEVDVCVELGRCPAPAPILGFQIAVEEFFKNPGAEAASKSGAIRCKGRVRPYIINEARNQVANRVDFERVVLVPRAPRPVRVYRVGYQVRVVFGIFLPNPEL